MRHLTLIAVLLFICFSSPADSFRLEGEAFHPSTNIDVVWKATNDLPHGLWIYKVLPDSFSTGVISNAMAIGHFTMKNSSTTSESRFQDEHLIYFFDWNSQSNHLRRFMYVAPTLGVINYTSQRNYNAPIEAVPTADEAKKMAEDVLFQLGIDRSLISNPKTGYDETNIKFKYDRETRQAIQPGTTNVTLRGVSFSRRIDGVQESSAWCFLIHFRSHGEIEDFSLCWRKILPSESHQVITPEEIVEMIKSGKAVLPPQMSDMTGLDSAKKITVVKITPRYYNGTSKESLDFMYPYADLEMTAEIESTNTTTFYLSCPILSTNAMSP